MRMTDCLLAQDMGFPVQYVVTSFEDKFLYHHDGDSLLPIIFSGSSACLTHML